jgi:hypothetical protein
MARARKSQNGKAAEFVCPECGRTFTRAAALGAHRRQAHGVVGASRQARSAKSGASTNATRAGAKNQRRRTRATPTSRTTVGSTSRSRRSSAPADRGVNRDTLLQALFPAGIPAKASVIRSVNSWLDEAERLAGMR